MEALDTVSIAILLGSLLVLAGVLSSLLAMRFGAPLLLVFLLIGVLGDHEARGPAERRAGAAEHSDQQAALIHRGRLALGGVTDARSIL